MIQSGHGRPRRFALGCLAFLALVLAAAPTAGAQDPLGNVVTAAVPRPAGNEIVLVRLQVRMSSPTNAVRRVGGVIPSGYAVGAVRARRRGSTVRIRLAAVRTGGAARGASMRLKLRLGGAGDVYRHAATRSTRIRPGTGPWRRGDCSQINAEAAGWRAVPGLAGMTVGGDRFGALTAVGASMEAACQRDVRAVGDLAAEEFLGAVDPRFVVEGGGAVEGFYATWTKNPDGTGKICVYVRGDWGGSGDLTINGTRTPFTLDDNRGLGRVDTVVQPGEYPFTVRWRQPDGTFRESGSSIRVPAGAVNGQGPPAPYDAAGPCA